MFQCISNQHIKNWLNFFLLIDQELHISSINKKKEVIALLNCLFLVNHCKWQFFKIKDPNSKIVFKMRSLMGSILYHSYFACRKINLMLFLETWSRCCPSSKDVAHCIFSIFKNNSILMFKFQSTIPTRVVKKAWPLIFQK